MYGWDLCPGTTTGTQKTYKEPWKLTNEAMITHKPGKHPTFGEPLAQSKPDWFYGYD